jgi:hypothetical protein
MNSKATIPEAMLLYNLQAHRSVAYKASDKRIKIAEFGLARMDTSEITADRVIREALGHDDTDGIMKKTLE